MASATLAPFLYQTRTLLRLLASPRLACHGRWMTTTRRGRAPRHDNAIPFEWDEDLQDDEDQRESTITVSEAEIFKGIFDEIAQGRMPTPRKRALSARQAPAPGQARAARSGGMARSIVEQARVTGFREKFLRRYPQSLRNAAQIALGLYELDTPSPAGAAATSRMLELDEADKAKWEERARYDAIRVAERERVDGLMAACDTDAALWRVMEDEVFSLPEKLGIATAAPASSKAKGAGQKRHASARREQTDGSAHKRIMDVHGPLYPHFLNTGLGLFDTGFARPSPYAFGILPRVKALGLPSYVLGVSTPFYARLARMHWDRFGDAGATLDVLREMAAAGLYADESVGELLARVRNHVHGCTWGAQGPFVMAVMEAPPYDGGLTQRLDDMERYVRESSIADEHHGA